METPEELPGTPQEREDLRVDLALILTAHPGYTWTDNGEACSGSRVFCNGEECDWEVPCIGTSGPQRRALHPAHITRLMEPRIMEFVALIGRDS